MSQASPRLAVNVSTLAHTDFVLPLTLTSFYGSQGRQGSTFLDDNATLVDTLADKHGIQTLEMETFVINHLAMCANVNGTAPHANRIRAGAVQMM